MAQPWHAQVDRFIYINLDTRKDRRAHIESVLNRLGIPSEKVERFQAIPSDPGWVGCAKSHRDAVQKSLRYDQVCILEDDFMPLVETQVFHATVQKAMDTLDGDFDMLMLAMTPVAITPVSPKPVLGGLVRIQTCLALPGYIISRRFMPTFIQIANKALNQNVPIDMVTQTYQGRSAWYGFFPPIARQMPGYSDIEKRHTDYGYLEVDGRMLK